MRDRCTFDAECGTVTTSIATENTKLLVIRCEIIRGEVTYTTERIFPCALTILAAERATMSIDPVYMFIQNVKCSVLQKKNIKNGLELRIFIYQKNDGGVGGKKEQNGSTD